VGEAVGSTTAVSPCYPRSAELCELSESQVAQHVANFLGEVLDYLTAGMVLVTMVDSTVDVRVEGNCSEVQPRLQGLMADLVEYISHSTGINFALALPPFCFTMSAIVASLPPSPPISPTPPLSSAAMEGVQTRPASPPVSPVPTGDGSLTTSSSPSAQPVPPVPVPVPVPLAPTTPPPPSPQAPTLVGFGTGTSETTSTPTSVSVALSSDASDSSVVLSVIIMIVCLLCCCLLLLLLLAIRREQRKRKDGTRGQGVPSWHLPSMITAGTVASRPKMGRLSLETSTIRSPKQSPKQAEPLFLDVHGLHEMTSTDNLMQRTSSTDTPGLPVDSIVSPKTPKTPKTPQSPREVVLEMQIAAIASATGREQHSSSFAMTACSAGGASPHAAGAA